MNYDHAYHAGNFADVFKHSVLCVLIEQLKKKDKPCAFIDTHSGLGLYSLTDERASKTQEANSGILKLLEQKTLPKELEPYIHVIKACMAKDPMTYPGSPKILADALREHDQLILNELHPKFFEQLNYSFRKNVQVSLHQRDAYEFLLAIVPPKIKRGLILIDPPFEKKDEYHRIQQTLSKALMKFATGVYVIWYPIVDQQDTKNIHKIRDSLSAYPSLRAEIKREPIFRNNRGLSGTGLLIINPPWQSEMAISHIAKSLCELFATHKNATWDVNLQEPR